MVTPYNRINQFIVSVSFAPTYPTLSLWLPGLILLQNLPKNFSLDSPSKPSKQFLSWFFLKTFPKPPSLWSGEAMAEKGLYYPLPKFSKGDLCLSLFYQGLEWRKKWFFVRQKVSRWKWNQPTRPTLGNTFSIAISFNDSKSPFPLSKSCLATMRCWVMIVMSRKWSLTRSILAMTLTTTLPVGNGLTRSILAMARKSTQTNCEHQHCRQWERQWEDIALFVWLYIKVIGHSV